MKVLNRGKVVEEGLVASVMHDPAHPYTGLLLDSVPRPDPDKRWTDRIEVDERGDRTGVIERPVTDDIGVL